MAMYALKDTTLTALGDAVRGKTSKLITVDNKPTTPTFEISFDTRTMEPTGEVSGNTYYEVPINLKEIYGDRLPDVRKLYTYVVKYESYCDGFTYFPGNLNIAAYDDESEMPNYTYSSNILALKSRPLSGDNEGVGYTDMNVLNTKSYFTVSLKAQSWVYKDNGGWFKCKLHFWGCDNDNKCIVPNTMTPLEMVDVINGLEIPNIEPVVLTSNQSYGCAGAVASQFIKNFGDKVSTDKITNASYMFYNTVVEEIPFSINFSSSSNVTLASMFSHAEKLKSVPPITGTVKVTALDNIF